MEPFVTPGVHRVWRLASGVARHRQAKEIEPEHLLWALVIDESRAAEILSAHQISSQRLRELLPPYPDVAVANNERPESLLRRSDSLDLVFIEARRQVACVGRHAEVGTEHLLTGLVTIETPVKKLLLEHGLEPATINLHSTGESGIATEPLPGEVHLSLAGPPVGENTDLYRVLDAGANRAREGLRVLEDYVRFTADDRHLSGILKAWRHRLADALQLLDGRALITARDTRGDVGTTIHTRREQTRNTVVDVVRASCKRVQEAARTLEEYGKILSPEFAAILGELRYASYTIEKAIVTTFESRDRLSDCRLYLLVTQAACPHGAGPVIRAALAAGASVIQVREKNLPDRELVEWGHYVREWTADAGALFIMNDRPDLAVLTDADGVHLGQDELSVRDARRIVGPHKLVGVSTHSIEQAQTAVLEGADYIGVGPVFTSKTKSFSELAGLELVRQVAAEITLPAFAIGGIDAQNVGNIVSAGLKRVAVSSAICGAEDPGQTTRSLLGQLVS